MEKSASSLITDRNAPSSSPTSAASSAFARPAVAPAVPGGWSVPAKARLVIVPVSNGLGLSFVPQVVLNATSNAMTPLPSPQHTSAASTSGQGQSGGSGSRSANSSPRRLRMKRRTRTVSSAASLRASGGAWA